MEQLELLSIENPCINVCESDKRGYCLGCYRSRDERFHWNKLSAMEKRQVIEHCKQRAKRRKAKAKKLLQQEIPTVTLENTKDQSPSTPEHDKAAAASEQLSIKDMGLDMFDL